MSDWGRALQNRVSELEEAQHRIDAADDSFLDSHHRRRLESAREEINDVIADTEDELALVKADWETVDEQTEVAISLVDDAINRLVDADLLEASHDGHARRLSIPDDMDDPPEVLLHMEDYLQSMEMRLIDLREATEEMKNEKHDINSTGGW